ncbi:hypothetical protein HU764_014935 [Pseudomonas sp. SWRI100]|uniref:hypothetical protein n=1 Tax=Pseudomonas kermanshahensis TaxID=2745482 RepID=UPI001C3E54A1|nr:hypothetical protein [Pseudomonas kermanshahensis]MBV4527392.1 hypothetical protein [Pseudomonas kermanshahensis]
MPDSRWHPLRQSHGSYRYVIDATPRQVSRPRWSRHHRTHPERSTDGSTLGGQVSAKRPTGDLIHSLMQPVAVDEHGETFT